MNATMEAADILIICALLLLAVFIGGSGGRFK